MRYKTYNFKQADIWALDHVYVGICELNSKNVLSQIITIAFTLGQSIQINTLGFVGWYVLLNERIFCSY